MKVHFAFRKIDGSLTELIEIDDALNARFGLILEPQRLSPPNGDNENTDSEARALAVVFDLLFIYHLFFITRVFKMTDNESPWWDSSKEQSSSNSMPKTFFLRCK